MADGGASACRYWRARNTRFQVPAARAAATAAAAMPSPPSSTQASSPLNVDGLAQVRVAPPNPRASMVTASRDALRIACTSRPKLWPRVARTRW